VAIGVAARRTRSPNSIEHQTQITKFARSPDRQIRLAVRPLLLVLGLRGGAMADGKTDKNNYDQDYLDKNTEIRRDTEIRDALGEPELHEDERIQKDDLLTGEEAEKQKPEHREK
jgi:hypothetical protein